MKTFLEWKEDYCKKNPANSFLPDDKLRAKFNLYIKDGLSDVKPTDEEIKGADKFYQLKPLSDKTEDTKESSYSTDEQLEKIYNVLNHIRWLMFGVIFIVFVVPMVMRFFLAQQ